MSATNKKDIQKNLITRGFGRNYIQRAFKVYQKKYGHSYNVEVITEIIIRLQNKDKTKRKNKDNHLSSSSKVIAEIIDRIQQFKGKKQNRKENVIKLDQDELKGITNGPNKVTVKTDKNDKKKGAKKLIGNKKGKKIEQKIQKQQNLKRGNKKKRKKKKGKSKVKKA